MKTRLSILRRWLAFAGCIAGLLLAAAEVCAGVDAALPAYQPEQQVTGGISSIGSEAMKPLMNAWLAALQIRQPGIRKGERWDHVSDATAFGALMYEIADLGPLARPPLATELAPYAHQFAGDMMKSPLLVRVGGAADRPATIAVNKRPDAPLPPKVKEFLTFALSREGQEIVAKQGQFQTLSAREAALERAKLQGYLAQLDPALPAYRPAAAVSGAINSDGSDGMKTLMNRWMRDFQRVQPAVRKGDLWEHLGTLNGFHALIANETELAPMGRELWPAEQAAYNETHHQNAPFEIRVARGGFNTPQRTTAQAVFVHQANPLARITLAQLAAILGRSPSITRWGQLGLGGEWANRPITIYMPPPVAPNAMSMQIMVLKGDAWNSAAHEGSIADTAQAIARDPGAIGFGGFEEGGPGLKTLAVAAQDGAPYYEGNGANASSGHYPLTRYMYIRLNRQPGAALAPQVKEFLRYILSREGQEPILYSGYFPLTAEDVQQELAKLESRTYAQELVDKTVARHPEVLELAISANNVIIASNRGHIGTKADQDDLAVINTGRPRWKINAEGNRIASELVLQDVSGDPIGAVSIVFPFIKGEDTSALQKSAEQMRDALRRQVINAANLTDPVPYVANFPASPYAQKLVDETMAKHPELLVLVMHVARPNGSDYPIIASSIGRIGKKADEGDLQVVETGQPILGAYGAKKTRFGIELVMRDISGKALGALSTGFAYKEGDNQQALLKKAKQIEAELRKQIPSLAKLCEPGK